MTETVRVAKLDPQRNGYGSDFSRFERSAGGAEWLRVLRRRGFDHFTKVGFPTVHEEAWKYTDVSPIAATPYHLSEPAHVPKAFIDQIAPSDGPRLVLINGRHDPSLSATPKIPGVELTSLAAALDHGGLEKTLATMATPEANAFVALNTAFLQDGAFLRIAPKSDVRSTIHIIHVATGQAAPAANHPRNLLILGEAGRVRIVETFATYGEGKTFTNAVTELFAGPAAHVEHTKVQIESPTAHHVGTLEVRQARDAHVDDHAYNFGGRLVRNDVNIRFAEPGAETTLNGLYILNGEQHVDNHTSIDHAVPHCTSREFYRGILDGRSRGVFYGKVNIRKDAQKSNAAQTNKNLILSQGALVDSIPALEINADDVKASHGSTIGQLDRDALFYLRSRGVGEKTAQSLLTYAFARDILDRVGDEALKSHLDSLVVARLPEGARVREVLHEIEA